MGSRGPIGKPPGEAHRRQASRPKALTVLERAAVAPEPIPPPPDGLSPATEALWDRVWRSEVAVHWDRESDLHVVERWAAAVEEADRLRRAIRRAGRLTMGSVGQLRPSPLYRLLELELKTIEHAEDRLGMSPMGRLRLGLLGVKGALTAEQLNRMVDGRGSGPVAVSDEFSDEFEPA